MHTRHFETIEQVEHVFARHLSGQERGLVQTYLATGERPYPGGCWHCTESEILKLTQWIDFYEGLVDEGKALSPTDDNASAESVGLPFGSDWG